MRSSILAQFMPNNFKQLGQSLSLIGVVVVTGLIMIIGLLFVRPAMLFISLLWFGALLTVVLPIRSQLIFFWLILPFVDLMKRIIYLDQNSSVVDTYLVLATQDIILLVVVLKIFVSALHSPLKIHWRTSDTALACFVIYSLFSALASAGTPLIARVATIGMYVWPMVMFYLAARYLSDATSLNKLFKLTITLAVIVALYGIWQFFIGVLPYEVAWIERAADTSANVAHLLYDASRGVFRTFGTLDSHSSYGIFLGIGLILTWADRYRLGWLLWAIVSLIQFVGLILSFTRFTWLMPILALGFIFLFSYSKIRPLFSLQRWRKASLLLMGIIASFFIFYALMSGLYGHNLVSSSNSYLLRAFGTGTLEARLQVNSLQVENARTFLLGKGLAKTGFFARKFDFESRDVNYHNIFVDMVDSMGLIGLGLFLWFLYSLLKQSLLNIKSLTDLRTRRLMISIIGLVLAMITVGHFNGAVFYFGRAIPAYFWAFCGIIAHYDKRYSP